MSCVNFRHFLIFSKTFHASISFKYNSAKGSGVARGVMLQYQQHSKRSSSMQSFFVLLWFFLLCPFWHVRICSFSFEAQHQPHRVWRPLHVFIQYIEWNQLFTMDLLADIGAEDQLISGKILYSKSVSSFGRLIRRQKWSSLSFFSF
jgi:hypothetical protein